MLIHTRTHTHTHKRMMKRDAGGRPGKRAMLPAIFLLLLVFQPKNKKKLNSTPPSLYWRDVPVYRSTRKS